MPELTPKRAEMRRREIDRQLSLLREELRQLAIARKVILMIARREVENIVAVPLCPYEVRP